MCQLWKLIMPLIVKPASPVTCTRLLKKGSSYCRRNYWQIYCGERKSRLYHLQSRNRCKCCEYRKCSWRTRHIDAGTEILHYTFQYALFHIRCSCTSPSSAAYHRRATVPVSLMLRSMAWNVHGFGSLHWGYLSPYRLEAAVPLPRPLPRIKCTSAYSRNV
jgi:hypothetical protein